MISFRCIVAVTFAVLLTGAGPGAAAPGSALPPGYDDPPTPPFGGVPPVRETGDCALNGRRAEVDAAIRASMGDSTPGVSVAVICKGDLVYEAGFGRSRLDRPHDRPYSDTVFRLASITKTMTAAVVLRLAEEGRLSLEDPVSRHLPDFPGGDRITLHQLLTHTSGLADFTEDATYPAHKAKDHSTAELVAWIASLSPRTRFEPGQGWAYSNSGYVLLGAVIEKLTGQSLQDAYAERLFQPLRLYSMAFDFPGGAPIAYAGHPGPRALGYRRDRAVPDGFAPAAPLSMTLPHAAGGLRATAIDTARFGDALFRGRILSPASLSRMTSPGLRADGRPNRWGMPPEWREGLQADYGLGVFVDEKTGRRRFWHSGDMDGFHTWLAHFPDDGVTLVILRNSENGDPMETEIQNAVLKALGL